MKLRSLKACVIIFGLLFPVTSMAWGVLGHRIVGQVAESYLTPKAKIAIRQILGNESLAMASNWGDFIKSDTSYKYLNEWHYLNLEDGLNHEAFMNYLAHDTAADAYTKINFLVKELKKKNLSLTKKKMYLRLLIHFVGDVHQPMHVSRAEDLGGNKIKLFWFNEPNNLHRLWDETLVNFQQLSYTEYAASINFTTPVQLRQWQKQPVAEWMFESYVISQKLYNEFDRPEPRLSYRYNFDHIQTLNERLLKGGVRLAGLLNEVFGK
jgi:hypothetical protein